MKTFMRHLRPTPELKTYQRLLTSKKGEKHDCHEECPFTSMGGNLFILGPYQLLRICVREEEVFDVLSACHDGPCRGHSVAKSIAFNVLQSCYYWPTLYQDATRYTNKCDQCQRRGNPTLKDEIPLQPQVTLEPFEKWGMDFIGPIEPPSGQKRDIIVCTDYLTKWAETKELKVEIEQKVAKFPRENIFYKFGVLRELVIDQGAQFTSNLIKIS